MNNKILVLCILLCTVFTLYINGQVESLYYLDESFEENASRAEWISFPADPLVKWHYMDGGYNASPVLAFDGDTNAILQRNDFLSFTRILISPPIDLSDAVKPALSFAHAQYPSVFGQDEMRLLFRAGPTGSWDTIAVITEPVEGWNEMFFNIDEYGGKYLTDSFYVGFSGTTYSGNGVCIDKVVIEEQGVIPKFIRNFSVEHVPHSLVPSGVNDIPLLKVYLEVFGNVDTMRLNSITFRSVSDDNTVFKDNGFELFATTSNVFRNAEGGESNKIGGEISMVDGNVVFSNLDYLLSTGRNYIWLTADIKPDRYTHGKTLDFMLVQNSISVSDTLLPANGINPEGINTVEESAFFDDFEGDKGWTLDYDFEMDIPQGFVANYTRDPDFAYSDDRVLGTDLTENGAYRMNIGAGTEYYAITPVLNLKYYIDAKLNMRTWNGFDGLDNATIDVSIDNGNTWNTLWVNSVDGLQAETRWNDLLFDEEFDALVRKQDNVRIRFAMNYSDNQFALSGFNIDNFAVTGNHLDSDVSITHIISPYDDCFGSHNDTVRIIVRNYADAPSPVNIPVFFSLNGIDGTRIYDTIPGPIPRNDSIVFTFTRTADFPQPGGYENFTVSIAMPGDEDPDNNTMVKPTYVQNTIVPPFAEDFETDGGYWITSANATWECLQPDGSIPVIPGSPTSWIQSPYGVYLNSDTSYIVSSCYDFSDVDEYQIIELKYWMETDEGNDGMNVQYTVDDGESWHIIDTTSYGAGWGWFTEHVGILDTVGWTRNTIGWQTVREILPAALFSKSRVKFRVYWSSNGSLNARGAAMDDFVISPASTDIGVVAVDSFANRCEGLNPDTVRVTIQNFGLNPLYESDTVIVGYDFNGGHIATDTILLAADLLPGEELEHTFTELVEVEEPGLYNITAYTLIEDDPWFYLSNNDTLSWDFEVYANPTVTMLGDTIQTQIPDTVILRPYYDEDYAYYWPHDGSSESTFNVPGSGMYDVQVTDEGGNGCISWDSAYVELLFNDAGVDSLIFPVDHCGLSGEEYLRVSLRNFGTDSLQKGDRIPVAFELNGGAAVRDTVELDETLLSGAWVEHVFSTGVDLSAKGMYQFNIYSDFEGDTVTSNNGIVRDIEIYGHPTVDLGPDLTVEALSHTLDAGPGYVSYQWSSGAITQDYEVTETGTYWVQVFDDHQCDGYDTAYIRLKIRDMTPAAFTSPVSACNYGGPEPVVLQLWNSGTDTIPSGQLIDVGYQQDGGSWVEESHTLAADLLPGQYVEHTFAGLVDLPMDGGYPFAASADMSGDIHTSNDTLRLTVYKYPAPVVDFGLEEVEYVEDISFDIEAGYSPYYAYDWQDDSMGHSYTAVQSGTYHVVVTDTRTSCFDRDTVILFLIYNDVGVTNTSMPAEGCSGTYEDITVRVTNLGTTNIGKDVPIYVACDVNGVQVTSEELTRTSNFAPGTYLDLVLTGDIPIDVEGVNDMAFYTLYNDDMKGWNDTLETDFIGLLSPDIDFGDVNGELNVGLPHDLDAGEGHKSYLWQDGFTGQVYTAVESGTYTVTVTGQNDCISEKTVRINPGTGVSEESGSGIELRIYPNPNEGRFMLEVKRNNTEELTMQVFDAGGRMVYVRSFNGGELIREEIDLGNLSRGVYHILITGSQPLYQGRMIIQ